MSPAKLLQRVSRLISMTVKWHVYSVSLSKYLSSLCHFQKFLKVNRAITLSEVAFSTVNWKKEAWIFWEGWAPQFTPRFWLGSSSSRNSGHMFPPFSCSASTAKVLLLAGLNRFRFFAAGHASGANFSGLKH